jgi:hypothetical protein
METTAWRLAPRPAFARIQMVHRRGLRAVVFCLAGLVSFGARAVPQPDLPEYRVKAAFVSKFPQFVEWPPEVWRDRKDVQVCVARPNPFGATLAELIAGETLNGRPLAVRELDHDDPIATCQVLVIGGPLTPAARSMLRRAVTLPLLTIGDRDGFLDQGGIIELQVVAGRLRFDINPAAADRVHLHLSSQLLRLARRVNGVQP